MQLDLPTYPKIWLHMLPKKPPVAQKLAQQGRTTWHWPCSLRQMMRILVMGISYIRSSRHRGSPGKWNWNFFGSFCHLFWFLNNVYRNRKMLLKFRSIFFSTVSCHFRQKLHWFWFPTGEKVAKYSNKNMLRLWQFNQNYTKLMWLL